MIDLFWRKEFCSCKFILVIFKSFEEKVFLFLYDLVIVGYLCGKIFYIVLSGGIIGVEIVMELRCGVEIFFSFG